MIPLYAWEARLGLHLSAVKGSNDIFVPDFSKFWAPGSYYFCCRKAVLRQACPLIVLSNYRGAFYMPSNVPTEQMNQPAVQRHEAGGRDYRHIKMIPHRARFPNQGYPPHVRIPSQTFSMPMQPERPSVLDREIQSPPHWASQQHQDTGMQSFHPPSLQPNNHQSQTNGFKGRQRQFNAPVNHFNGHPGLVARDGFGPSVQLHGPQREFPRPPGETSFQQRTAYTDRQQLSETGQTSRYTSTFASWERSKIAISLLYL